MADSSTNRDSLRAQVRALLWGHAVFIGAVVVVGCVRYICHAGNTLARYLENALSVEGGSWWFLYANGHLLGDAELVATKTIVFVLRNLVVGSGSVLTLVWLVLGPRTGKGRAYVWNILFELNVLSALIGAIAMTLAGMVADSVLLPLLGKSLNWCLLQDHSRTSRLWFSLGCLGAWLLVVSKVADVVNSIRVLVREDDPPGDSGDD